MPLHNSSSNIEKVLITGGAGFIGSHLVEALVDARYKVCVYDNLSSGELKNLESVIEHIDFVEGDILNFRLLKEASKGCCCIFHLAAISNIAESIENPFHAHQVNTLGTLNVLEAARTHHARVVYSSSAAIYGDNPTLPKEEGLSAEPISPYGTQKLLGEHYLGYYHRFHGVEGVALRYFNVYGLRQNPASPYSGVITKFKERLDQHQAPVIYGDGSQTRDFVYVRDVVMANLLSMTTSLPFAILNVGTGTPVSVLELASEMTNMLGQARNFQFESKRDSDILHSVCDPSRAKKVLGFESLTHLSEGLHHTLEI